MSKNKLAGSALILVAALMGAAAYAQDATPAKPMQGPFDFATLDADKDGKVTAVSTSAFQRRGYCGISLRATDFQP